MYSLTLPWKPIKGRFEREQGAGLFSQDALRKFQLSFDRSHKRTYFIMNVTHHEAEFLCLHLKGLKMSYRAAAKYMKKFKTFVSKWVKCYSANVKHVDDLIVDLCDEKGGQNDLMGV